MFVGNPLPGRALAAGGSGKTLVVIFQRGGCDGLNTIVPYGDGHYYGLRPTLAIPPPGMGGAIDLDGYFGLHPSLAPLHEIYIDGRLAIMPAVHFAESTLSHFANQLQIESASNVSPADGWMSRYLSTTTSAATMRATAFGSMLPHAMKGDADVPVFTDLSSTGLDGSSSNVADFIERFRTVYSQPVGGAEAARAALHRSGLTLLNKLESLPDLDQAAYAPDNGAVYPDNPFGSQLRQAAQLIKSGLGLELINIDFGGWDTHANQGGAESDGEHARLLAGFADGIHAFYTDLGTLMDDVMVLSMTEFGRTAAENASGGTDHGRASAWMVLGGGVNGGIYGDWPGLAPGNLRDGRYLDFSVDYRDILAELLAGHLGLSNTSSVLPGFAATPIGFV